MKLAVLLQIAVDSPLFISPVLSSGRTAGFRPACRSSILRTGNPGGTLWEARWIPNPTGREVQFLGALSCTTALAE